MTEEWRNRLANLARFEERWNAKVPEMPKRDELETTVSGALEGYLLSINNNMDQWDIEDAAEIVTGCIMACILNQRKE